MGLFLAKVFGNMNESEPKVFIFLVKKLFFVEESFEVFLFFFDLLWTALFVQVTELWTCKVSFLESQSFVL